MKRFLAGMVVLAGLPASEVVAQRGGSVHGGSVHGGTVHGGASVRRPGNVVVPPLGPSVPALGPTTPITNFNSFSGFHHRGNRGRDQFFPFWGAGAIYDLFYAGSYENYPLPTPPSIVVLIPQFQLPPPPGPPPAPIRPQTQEYKWPASASGGDSGATAFSIVSKDQRVRSAIAVWVQNRNLCYVAPDGSNGRIPLNEVDREATRRRNAEKQLNLPLPGDNSGG